MFQNTHPTVKFAHKKRGVRVEPAPKLPIMLGEGCCPWVSAFWVRNRLMTETAGIPRQGPILECVADISRSLVGATIEQFSASVLRSIAKEVIVPSGASNLGTSRPISLSAAGYIAKWLTKYEIRLLLCKNTQILPDQHSITFTAKPPSDVSL